VSFDHFLSFLFVPSIVRKALWGQAPKPPASLRSNCLCVFADFDSQLERNMVKDIISTLLAKGYNYIRCTHDPRAMSMCEAAQKFSSAQKISQSRFCPRPDTEPTLICQAEHWYMAKTDAHAKLMSGLDSFENFQRDRFKFTLPEFFQEAYNEWTRCGNQCDEITWKLGPFERDMNWAGTFHLPICKSDQTHIADFTHDYEWWVRDGNPKHWPGWYRGEFTKFSFPSSCGDWKSNDTMEFLEAMNAGEWKNDTSPFYHPIAEMLWRDRIPRVSDSFSCRGPLSKRTTGVSRQWKAWSF
jgi:hypothetical protein